MSDKSVTSSFLNGRTSISSEIGDSSISSIVADTIGSSHSLVELKASCLFMKKSIGAGKMFGF